MSGIGLKIEVSVIGRNAGFEFALSAPFVV